jgi:hypothetical protein
VDLEQAGGDGEQVRLRGGRTDPDQSGRVGEAVGRLEGVGTRLDARRDDDDLAGGSRSPVGEVVVAGHDDVRRRHRARPRRGLAERPPEAGPGVLEERIVDVVDAVVGGA